MGFEHFRRAIWRFGPLETWVKVEGGVGDGSVAKLSYDWKPCRAFCVSPPAFLNDARREAKRKPGIGLQSDLPDSCIQTFVCWKGQPLLFHGRLKGQNSELGPTNLNVSKLEI